MNGDDIRIGNQTSFAASALLEPFAYAIANSFRAFEFFPNRRPGGSGWNTQDLGKYQREFVKQAAKKNDIVLSVHAALDANPITTVGRMKLWQDLELACDISARLVNIHLVHQYGIPAFIESILPFTEVLQHYRIRLSIENTKSHSPEQINELFRRLGNCLDNSNYMIGLCLDIGHANLHPTTRNDYLAFLGRLEPTVPIIHLHLHENYGNEDSHLTIFTGPAAENPVGVTRLLQQLLKRRFSGAIILEQWPQPASLLCQARDRLRSLLETLV